MGDKSDKFVGKGKQTAGKAMDNKEMQAKGKMQEGKGQLKGTADNVTDDF